jgi:hypothetical protein
MVSRTLRFNLNLWALVALAACVGCQTPEQKQSRKREKQLATIRVHLEIGSPRPGQTQQAAVLRAAPILLNIEKNPFLNEIHVQSAQVVEHPGGFALAVRFNTQGKWLLEQYTATNPNRRLAVRCQWGVAPDVQDRWVAAPLISGRIVEGVLTFTPDASRDEADQIAIGLNNFAGDTLLKERTEPPATTTTTPAPTGGTK